MCCGEDAVLDLPAPVLEALAGYRRMRAASGWGWGEDGLPDLFRWARFSLLGAAFDALAVTGDWAAAVRAALGDGDPPAGVAVVTTGPGGELVARTGPLRPGPAGASLPVDVVVLSDAADDRTVSVAGTAVPVPAGGVGLAVVDVDPAAPAVPVTCGAARAEVVAVTAVPAARLRVSAPACARWSVTDATGGGWGPPGPPAKWDATHRPYWHAREAEFDVPAGPLEVVVARGLEWRRTTLTVTPGPGETAEVAWEPERRFDPAAGGWYGGDLHVHLNYSGDAVLEPADAARMQAGEGLHLVQLVAGNLGGTLVYDRELLETTAGRELWSGERVGMAGLEYRNDLLGHVHASGLAGVPALVHTGHEGTDAPWDWPPNAAACAAMRDLGGLTSYAHPVYSALTDVGQLYAPARTVEARELVADAALGLVDAVEVVSCFDDRGAVALWHRLLDCGLRLAAVAGTDAFLSFAHGPGVASNPPGWGRVYAHLGTEPLTAAGFRAAVAAGRTVVTNGPWLTLDVDGAGPGAVLDRSPGDRLAVRAGVTGGGVDRLVLHGAGGTVLAETDGAELAADVPVAAGTWLAAAAYGGDDEHTPGAPVFAHTGPVYVDVDGRRVAVPASARWCLAALDALEALVTAEGRFDPARRAEQVGALRSVVEAARAVYRRVASGERRAGPDGAPAHDPSAMAGADDSDG
ncbi:CehA/McbA family metallohydrolase [Geodermatophilus sp. URMC 62]|uniref:CehA/McbA family metallohydrolase n=1 Tax=Geodermatophilus sp. URMC 62 TaxID=3423414 RepID=UPI00406CDB61